MPYLIDGSGQAGGSVVDDRDGQRQRRESSRLAGADARPVRVLLPRSKYELVERVLAAAAALFTIAAALAPLRGVGLGTLALLGVAGGGLALAAAVVGALRPETPLASGSSPADHGAHGLPPSPVQFVGRRIRIFLALRYLRRREHEARVLALSGMPGVGKTALALVLARQLRQSSYPDNQLFIQLSGGREPPMNSQAALLEALLQLKVPASDIAAHSGRWRQLYLETLRGTRSLVILD